VVVVVDVVVKLDDSAAALIFDSILRISAKGIDNERRW